MKKKIAKTNNEKPQALISTVFQWNLILKSKKKK